MINLMVDLETMGLRPDAAIVSIGAVMFDANELGPEFYTPVCLEDCKRLGLTTDQSTVDWWAKQSEDARAAWSDEHAPMLLEVMSAFTQFVRQEGGPDVLVWGNGAAFDPVLLESAYRVLDADPPWKFYNVRCFRTMKNVYSNFPVPRQGTHHHALDDAKHQARVLQHIAQTHGLVL
jgi:3' exoribonuclease, RNase T-like